MLMRLQYYRKDKVIERPTLKSYSHNTTNAKRSDCRDEVVKVNIGLTLIGGISKTTYLYEYLYMYINLHV